MFFVIPRCHLNFSYGLKKLPGHFKVSFLSWTRSQGPPSVNSPLIQYIEFQHNEDSTMEHEDYLDSLTREFVFITGIIHMFFLVQGKIKQNPQW